MNKAITLFCACLLAGTALAHQPPTNRAPAAHAPSKLKLANLLRAELAGAPNTEVIVSRVHIPPNTSLPRHWHPGEEFVYVISGRVTLWQRGNPDTTFGPGDVAKVPLRQVHTAITSKKGCELIVFRVHEKGQPERVPVQW